MEPPSGYRPTARGAVQSTADAAEDGEQPPEDDQAPRLPAMECQLFEHYLAADGGVRVFSFNQAARPLTYANFRPFWLDTWVGGVVGSRAAWGGRIMRRRECRNCGKRMTTWERP